jgi:hypothetical protein
LPSPSFPSVTLACFFSLLLVHPLLSMGHAAPNTRTHTQTHTHTLIHTHTHTDRGAVRPSSLVTFSRAFEGYRSVIQTHISRCVASYCMFWPPLADDDF